MAGAPETLAKANGIMGFIPSSRVFYPKTWLKVQTWPRWQTKHNLNQQHWAYKRLYFHFTHLRAYNPLCFNSVSRDHWRHRSKQTGLATHSSTLLVWCVQITQQSRFNHRSSSCAEIHVLEESPTTDWTEYKRGMNRKDKLYNTYEELNINNAIIFIAFTSLTASSVVVLLASLGLLPVLMHVVQTLVYKHCYIIHRSCNSSVTLYTWRNYQLELTTPWVKPDRNINQTRRALKEAPASLVVHTEHASRFV